MSLADSFPYVFSALVETGYSDCRPGSPRCGLFVCSISSRTHYSGHRPMSPLRPRKVLVAAREALHPTQHQQSSNNSSANWQMIGLIVDGLQAYSTGSGRIARKTRRRALKQRSTTTQAVIQLGL